MQTYYYLYYFFYKLLKALNARNEIVQWSAFFSVMIIVSINLILIADIVELNGKLPYFLTLRAGFEGIGVMVMIINYFIFMYKQKYLLILKECERTDTGSKAIICLIYIILSFCLMLYAGKQIREMNFKAKRPPGEIIDLSNRPY
jgi:hypothetical protein